MNMQRRSSFGRSGAVHGSADMAFAIMLSGQSSGGVSGVTTPASGISPAAPATGPEPAGGCAGASVPAVLMAIAPAPPAAMPPAPLDFMPVVPAAVAPAAGADVPAVGVVAP